MERFVKLVKGAWKILVGIKDGLVLVFMLLFFIALFGVLSARPNAASIRDGALVVALDGMLVEQPQEADPFASVTGGDVMKQQRLRDVVRGLDAAVKDDRVKAVVLDLDRFMGGYPAAVSEVANGKGQRQAGAGLCHRLYRQQLSDRGQCQRSVGPSLWRHFVRRAWRIAPLLQGADG
jgi:protease-4